SDRQIVDIFEKIALLSESRGKDSSGVAFRDTNSKQIDVIKGDIPISRLIKSNEYRKTKLRNVKSALNGNGFCAFGHARLVTNGSQLKEQNNQPVIKDDFITIHNGIIVNGDDLWM